MELQNQDDGVEQAKVSNRDGVSKHDPELNHDGSLDRKIGEAKELQARTPWHREGAEQPPVRRTRRASAMTKGDMSLLCRRVLGFTQADLIT
jgi:hypothetical protein